MVLGPIAQRQSRGLIIPWLQVRILLGPFIGWVRGTAVALLRTPSRASARVVGDRSPFERGLRAGTSSAPPAYNKERDCMHGSMPVSPSVRWDEQLPLF